MLIVMICGPLSCCSSPVIISLTPLICGKNLTCPEPYSKNYIGESQADLDNCLPYYTAGFE